VSSTTEGEKPFSYDAFLKTYGAKELERSSHFNGKKRKWSQLGNVTADKDVRV